MLQPRSQCFLRPKGNYRFAVSRDNLDETIELAFCVNLKENAGH